MYLLQIIKFILIKKVVSNYLYRILKFTKLNDIDLLLLFSNHKYLNFIKYHFLNIKKIDLINGIYSGNFNEKINHKIFSKFKFEIVKKKLFLTSIYPSEAIVIFSLLKKHRINTFLEFGVGRGDSTWMISQLIKNDNLSINYYAIGNPKQHEINSLRKFTREDNHIKFTKGLIPSILNSININTNKKIAIFIDGPKGSDEEFMSTLHYIFEYLNPRLVLIHDVEKSIPYYNFISKCRLNLTRIKLISFFQNNLDKNKYQLTFFNNLDNYIFRKIDNLHFKNYKNQLAPYFFKNSKNLSYGPGIGMILKK